METVVMAAGEGRRLRPLTEHFAKPVLPIDGRPVVVTLLWELKRAGVGRITVVTGHLAEQVERLLAGFPHELRFVRQPEALGAADAVRRAGLDPPYLVLGADTRFTPGDVAAFAARAPDYDSAVAVRPREGSPSKDRVKVDGELLTAFGHDDPEDTLAGAPLWFLGPAAHRHLDTLPGPPFELREALQRVHDEGGRIGGIRIGPTRDLTHPVDLIRENFPYLVRP
jgi:GTP:adenosylcobinamide-phosphate guanylyltransferase